MFPTRQISTDEAETVRTILDYLNEDCWRVVLDYVPLEDILRTEPASQRWQETVLAYLRGIRIDIKTPPRFWRKHVCTAKPKWCYYNRNGKKNKFCKPRLSRCSRSQFENWTKKLGPSVVTAYCDSTDSLKMYENCPNLETLTIIDLPEEMILHSPNENYKWLKRLSFKQCEYVSDRCVSRFMANNTIEELEIHGNSEVTGKCLINKKSMKLKALSMKLCRIMKLTHLLAASEYFGGLKKIELSGSSVEIYKNIHLMLDNMPKLEHVKMQGVQWDGRNFFEAVCRLKHLKDICVDFYARDDDLEAVTRCCPELKALRLRSCDAVSGRGLAVACRQAGSRLVALGVECTQYQRTLKDDHIVACIRACPNLKVLNLRGNRGLTRNLFVSAAAARRELGATRPLKLRWDSFNGFYIQDEFEELNELIIVPYRR